MESVKTGVDIDSMITKKDIDIILAMVKKKVRDSYPGWIRDADDFAQECFMAALTNARKCFKPSKKTKLVTFMVNRARGHLKDIMRQKTKDFEATGEGGEVSLDAVLDPDDSSLPCSRLVQDTETLLTYAEIRSALLDPDSPNYDERSAIQFVETLDVIHKAVLENNDNIVSIAENMSVELEQARRRRRALRARIKELNLDQGDQC